jgi:hypothetical protein
VGPDEYETIWKRETERFLQDIRQLRAWEGSLHNFSGNSALKRWRQLNPTEFGAFARRFLASVTENSDASFHLNCFVDAVLCNLLAIAPAEAVEWCRRLRVLPFKVDSYYEVSTFVAALWDVTDCNSPEHKALRTQIFREARDEARIMALTVAAQAEGGAQELTDLITLEFLRSRLSRDRALAVSILAWIADERAVETLERLAQEDPSHWVREHAEWAEQVARGECSARQYYRETLSEKDPIIASARLWVLEAALTPTARWWRHCIDRDTPSPRPSRTRAVIEAFWSGWENTSPSSLQVYDRKLDEFCCGESLGSVRSPQLAPWWRP